MTKESDDSSLNSFMSLFGLSPEKESDGVLGNREEFPLIPSLFPIGSVVAVSTLSEMYSSHHATRLLLDIGIVEYFSLKSKLPVPQQPSVLVLFKLPEFDSFKSLLDRFFLTTIESLLYDSRCELGSLTSEMSSWWDSILFDSYRENALGVAVDACRKRCRAATEEFDFGVYEYFSRSVELLSCELTWIPKYRISAFVSRRKRFEQICSRVETVVASPLLSGNDKKPLSNWLERHRGLQFPAIGMTKSQLESIS